MNTIIQAGFTGSNFAEQFRPDWAKKPADKVEPDGEIIEGTGEIDNSPKTALEAAIDNATGFDPNEAAASATDEQTDTPEDNEAPEGADDLAEGTLPTMDPPKKAALFDAHTPYEKAIAKYLEANASDELKRKIRDAKKHGYGIKECFAYITSEARKLAKGNCAMVEDATVYGWAVHYFEDEVEADLKRKANEAAKRAADEAKREAERKAKAEAEAARLAAMTPEERELEERAKAEAAAAEALAKEDEKRAKVEEAEKRKAEQKALKKLEKEAYEAAKNGDTKRYSLDAPDWTDAQKAAIKAGNAKAKAEIAAEKKAEREAKAAKKAAAEAAQGDLFAGLFN